MSPSKPRKPIANPIIGKFGQVFVTRTANKKPTQKQLTAISKLLTDKPVIKKSPAIRK
ncbi:MAG: hypothetical protein WCX82_01190 [archaeon]|jgi:hypothetical protein